MVDIYKNIYRGKKVLITGHTGFKGVWMTEWLISLGAEVIGISKDIPTEPSHFRVNELSNRIKDYRIDVRDYEQVLSIFKQEQPNIVFHLAAQPLVRYSYEDPYETHSTNIIGTLNVLEAMRLTDVAFGIIITSDKSYRNVEWKYGYRENDLLGGSDPYSASKASAEALIKSYQDSYFNKKGTGLVAVRAGNVIGGGDWANDRIVPDIVRKWSSSEVVEVRNPKSTRPWQHVLEPISGYLLCGMILLKGEQLSPAYNFGPKSEFNVTVGGLIEECSKYWINNPGWEDKSQNTSKHESNLLKLNCDLALSDLMWFSVLTFHETIRMTVEWYKKFYDGDDIPSYTRSQIEDYSKKVQQRANYV